MGLRTITGPSGFRGLILSILIPGVTLKRQMAVLSGQEKGEDARRAGADRITSLEYKKKVKRQRFWASGSYRVDWEGGAFIF